MIKQAINWLVPHDLRSKGEQRRASRAIVLPSAILIWAPVFGPSYYLLGSPRGALVIGLAALVLIVAVVSLRLTKSVFFTGHMVACDIFVMLVVLATLTNGPGSPSLWWLPAVPITALVICGKWSGITWAVISSLACLAFLLNDRLELVLLADEIVGPQFRLLNSLATIGIILCAFSLILVFKLSEDAARHDLEIARLESEAANRAMVERFRATVDAAPTAMLVVDEAGDILLANHQAEEMFGYPHGELIGQKVEVLIPSRFQEQYPRHREAFFRNPVQRDMGAALDLFAIRKDGSEFPVKVGLSPIETDDGSAVICGVLDVTQQKLTLENLQCAKEAAESASRAKSSFLANMSHEIRTPMNGIIGMSQLLAQTELRSHQRDYLSTVDESAHILLRLLNDILDFSKIEAGKLELECVEFRLSDCVARASQMLALRAAEKGLEMTCRVAPEIPDHLEGDSGRIQQVLVNLLGNAVKFTEVGEIFVNVNAESITEHQVRLHFSVSDTGIGISPDKLEQIFRPFEQAESSTTRRFGGTGLGLAISKQLVEMMRGRIWIESELGRGSTFHFTAEFGVSADQQEREPAELRSLQDIPVLVIDDNFTNRRILSEMLKYWQMRPILADSAIAARQAIQKANESQQPIRLILLDHHMPGEDGVHFADSLRQSQDSGSCPIIMISSGSSSVDADLCASRGIGRFLTKPVIASELLNEVLCQFSRIATVKPEQPLPLDKSVTVPPRRVLLVEDNEINRRVALGLLRSRGHQAEVAENGKEAVDRLAEQEFDVVLMDMQMPVMDGYEATAMIRDREHQTGGRIPIVAMTAEALKGDRERCLEAGMDDYVSKPISPTEMYRAIERFPAICLRSQSGIRPAPTKRAPTETIPPAEKILGEQK